MKLWKKNKPGNGISRIKKVPAVCLLFLLCLGFFAGAAVEGVFELNVYRRELKGNHVAEDETIPDSAVKIEQVSSQENQEEAASKVVSIPLKERYIHKLQYTYKSQENFTAEIVIDTKNIYKNPESRVLKEAVTKHLQTSVVNIDDYVTEINLLVPEEVEIGTFTILNGWDWNWYRVFYVGGFAFLILCVVVYRKEFALRIENGFLVIVLTAGLLFLAVQPPKCNTWDEHIHFKKTFYWFEEGEVQQTTAESYIYHNPETLDGAPFLSKEEKRLQIEYLNEHTQEPADVITKEANPLNAVGELHMALVVKAAQALHVPFYVQFLLGKMTNLFLYAFLMYWAIRIVPVGKKFLTVLALMPTMMLQATSYTYDIVVSACVILGFCMIVEEFYEINRKITWKKQVLIGLVFLVGCCPKPVYMPLCALMLVMPKEKFGSKTQMYICKGAAALLSVGMLMTMILPAAGGSVEADPRGGATNVGQQLALVAGHPIGYFIVFLQNFFKTANQYIFGFDSLTGLAYAGRHPFDYLIAIFCVGVALTEQKKRMVLTKKNTIFYKGLLAFLIMIVIGLVWSALYICFTPVGSTSISGVQPRYYIPLLFPVYMLFYNCKMEAKWKEENYNMVMFLIVLFITHTAMYQPFFVSYCL